MSVNGGGIHDVVDLVDALALNRTGCGPRALGPLPGEARRGRGLAGDTRQHDFLVDDRVDDGDDGLARHGSDCREEVQWRLEDQTGRTAVDVDDPIATRCGYCDAPMEQ